VSLLVARRCNTFFSHRIARHDTKVFAVRDETLKDRDDMNNMGAIDVRIDHHTLEDCGVGDRLLALPEWR
jgi:hypothetical protein